MNTVDKIKREELICKIGILASIVILSLLIMYGESIIDYLFSKI